MLEIIFSIILMPFAALAVVFAGAFGVGVVKGIYEHILKKGG